MRSFKVLIRELRGFLILWLTQSFSALGSAMTNFALIVWSYQAQGSALTTALLSVCSYAPYVVMSIFAGALSDRWNKKAVMLASDSFAALCTVAVLVLLQAGQLEIWHLYCLNALNGLMNTVQQPAADVAISLLTPERHYQKASGLRSLANSLINMLTPMFATALLALAGIHAVILFDLFTFFAAFLSLLFLVKLPAAPSGAARAEDVLCCARQGLRFLKGQRGILHLILFLAAINFTASVYNAAFPAMLLSRQGGGEAALGAVNTATGAALLLGSAAASALPPPKSRVRAVCNTLLLAMSTENFFLAFGRSVPVWCLGAVLGWAAIPLMNANLDVLMRTHIPIAMQGRVFAARNTLQFFTIPLGYFAGGLLVDKVFEPLMARRPAGSLLCVLFGAGKGSGAALLFFLLGLLGAATCLVFRRDRQIWALECPDGARGGGGGGRRPPGGRGARHGPGRAPAAAGFSPVPQFHFSSKRPPGHARHREAGIQFCGQPAADPRGGGRQRSTWWGYSSSTSAVRFTWPSFLGAAAAVRPISLSAFSITLAAISSASSGFCRRYSLALSRPCPKRTSP